jgi:hypothetical protein
LRFIRNSTIGYWEAHINSNNPPPDLKYQFRDLSILATV